MATTIQVVENVKIGRYMEIDGQRCEVEAASFTPAITEGQAIESLMKVMAEELISRDVIKKDRNGQYLFCDTGEPLIEDEEFQD